MKKFFLLILLFLFSLLLFSENENIYYQTYEQLIDPQVNPAEIYSISNRTITRDAAILTINNGYLIKLDKINGKEIGFVITGNLLFEYTPTTEVEQTALENALKSTSFTNNPESVLIWATDSTFTELTKTLTPVQNPDILKSADSFLNSITESYVQKKFNYVDTNVMNACLNKNYQNFFMLSQLRNGFEVFSYTYNPYAFEETSLVLNEQNWGRKHKNSISSHYSINHNSKEFTEKNVSKYQFSMEDIHLTADVSRKYKFTGIADFKLKTRRENLEWANFYLYHDLFVDSLFIDGIKSEKFGKQKENPVIWIGFEEPLPEDETKHIEIYYSGNILEQSGKLVYNKTYDMWYPHYGERSNHFKVTTITPKKKSTVTAGIKISEEVEGDFRIAVWETVVPVNFAPLVIGQFKQDKLEDPRIPKINVSMGRIEKNVTADVANSMFYFQQQFGELPLEEYLVSEVPILGGEAYPGLINLSTLTFEYDNSHYGHELLRSHEVAHQWWGCGVDAESYHDMWIYEGLAEYCALTFMHLSRQNDDEFYTELETRRDKVFYIKDSHKALHLKEKPMWLGYRSESSETLDSESLTNKYFKSSLVMHMLRNLMINWKEMDDTLFHDMLRDFYTTYKGKEANTEDFQHIVEKHMASDMDWFFDQYVYGTDLPIYKFSYEQEEQADGKFTLKCKVIQKNVPEEFMMYVPIRLDFGKGRSYVIRTKVTGETTEFTVPNVPLKTKKVEFNAYYSVLCKSN